MKDIVFIVSPGRTGTAFLGRYLSDMIDGALSVHEPDLYHGLNSRTWQSVRQFGVYYMAIGRALGRTGARTLSLDYITGNLSHDRAVEQVRRSRCSYFMRRPESLIIECNGQWSLVLPVLRDAFPKAKIVAIVRDPRAWVSSWLSKGGRYDSRDIIGRYGAKRLNPQMLKDPVYGPQWSAMTQFDKLCWEWTFVTGELLAFSKTDALSTYYRFEDLFTGEHRAAAFRGLLQFIADHHGTRYRTTFDEALMNEKVNATEKTNEADWLAWSEERLAALHSTCGNLMNELGYSEEATSVVERYA